MPNMKFNEWCLLEQVSGSTSVPNSDQGSQEGNSEGTVEATMASLKAFTIESGEETMFTNVSYSVV
jgi:hypothetical protein